METETRYNGGSWFESRISGAISRDELRQAELRRLKSFDVLLLSRGGGLFTARYVEVQLRESGIVFGHLPIESMDRVWTALRGGYTVAAVVRSVLQIQDGSVEAAIGLMIWRD